MPVKISKNASLFDQGQAVNGVATMVHNGLSMTGKLVAELAKGRGADVDATAVAKAEALIKQASEILWAETHRLYEADKRARASGPMVHLTSGK